MEEYFEDNSREKTHIVLAQSGDLTELHYTSAKEMILQVTCTVTT